jgi:hypothetical protein
VFHANLHEVAVSIIARNVTNELVDTFDTLECIEMVHLKSSNIVRSKENDECNVSVNIHFV